MDANIVIAAFLRDSTVRRLLSFSFLEFMMPEFWDEEVAKHLPELQRRAKMDRASAEVVLHEIKELLMVIPRESTLSGWDRAAAAMAGIDSNDTPYVAAALGVPCDGIWSDDPDLKHQRVVPCWTTKELVEALRGEGFDI